jgi:DNA-binding transcriptional regulator GbsR (MarR family)
MRAVKVALKDAMLLGSEQKWRITRLLAEREMTIQEIAAEIGVSVPTAHEHVTRLKKAGIIKLTRTEVKRGVVKKYYRTTSNVFFTCITFKKTKKKDIKILEERMIQSLNDFFRKKYNLKLSEKTINLFASILMQCACQLRENGLPEEVSIDAFASALLRHCAED